MLMETMKLYGASAYDSHMAMHTSTVNTDISLAREFKNFFQTQHGHMDFWITVRTENVPVNGSGTGVSIIPNKENMCHAYQLKCHVQQLSSQNCHFAVRMKNFMK